jgi:MFS family permease
LIWALLLLAAIREPVRRNDGPTQTDGASGTFGWRRLVPLYLAVAMASLVDNAVGAWSPSLLMRRFALPAEQVGVTLGWLLVVGFGSGVLLGGVLADRGQRLGGAAGKLRVCLIAALLILPVSLLVLSNQVTLVLAGVPLYFLLSGIVTAAGFSAILDSVPNRSRGLAMSISFFLNVALGGGLGPTFVALAGDHLFGAEAGLAPPIALVVAGGFACVVGSVLLSLRFNRPTAQN